MDEKVDASVVARHFNIGKGSVYKWAEEGRIPAYRVGRCLRFDLRELVEVMRRRASMEPKRSDQ